MNVNFTKYLKDLSLIEKVLLTTYGPNGKTALVQSINKHTSVKSFMSTNDGSCLLNSMEFTDNQILKIISNSIRNHSNTNGDNCKSLFIYCFNLLNSLATYRDIDELKQITSFLRIENLFKVYNQLNSKWNEKNLLVKIETKAHFLDYLPSMAVLQDLKSLNNILSDISADLIVNLITYYTAESICLKDIKNKLHFLADHFDSLVFYSEKYPITNSKLYTDGFYMNRRFNLKHFDVLNSSIKAIFLIKSTDEYNSKSNTFVKIDSSLEDNVFKYLTIGNDMSFSTQFITSLKQNNISLILLSGSLTEMQKSQLNSIKCSLISYIDNDYMTFLCDCYSINAIYLNECNLVDLSDRKYVIDINFVENLDSEQLFYFKVVSSVKQLAFINFCSPVKMFFHQFKTFFLKCMKTLLTIFDSNLILKCNYFETVSAEICKDIELNSCKQTNERFFYKFLFNLFECLDFKFQKIFYLNNRDFLLSRNKLNELNLFEPFDLKLKCFNEALSIVQHILKIDSICYVKKVIIKGAKIDDSDSD